VASGMLVQKYHLVFAVPLHLLYLILDDDGLVNQMLKIWIVSVEQLKLDHIIETLEKRILLLLIGADVIGGIPCQLNELIQIFIHHHTPLVQVEEFLLLQLEGAAGHVVSSETSLELILGYSLDVGEGVTVSLLLFQIAGAPRREPSHGRNIGPSLVSSRLTSSSPLPAWDPWPERMCWGRSLEIHPA
jgi:hypothetical protein